METDYNAEPIHLHYYTCLNFGVGVAAYPQFRDPGNPSKVLWDGRDEPGFRYLIPPGGRVLVDLDQTGIERGTRLLLSSNTVFGTDCFEAKQVFKYEPDATRMVIALRTGTAGTGVLEWIGEKAYGVEQFRIDSSSSNIYDVALHSPESLLPAAAVEQVIGTLESFQIGSDEALWKGTVEWPNVATITIGISCIALYLTRKSYHVSYATDGKKTEFKLAPKGIKEGLSVEEELAPEELINDWKASLKLAAKYTPKDIGITEIMRPE